MKESRMERISGRIKAAVVDAEAKGWRLAPGVTLNPAAGSMCPLGAVVLARWGNNPEAGGSMSLATAARYLGLTARERDEFIGGVDGLMETAGTDSEHAMYQLGEKYRAQALG